MNKPGAVGATNCVNNNNFNNKGLRFSAQIRPQQPPLLDDSSCSSSDDDEMAGSPKKSPKQKARYYYEILLGDAHPVSFNTVFQVLTTVFTFTTNAFLLRHVSHDVLGICNVRLALLYSSVTFLSREPFRRTVLRENGNDSWLETINRIWFVCVPVTIFWSLLLGLIWCHVLSQPGPSPDSELAKEYRASVLVMCIAVVFDSFTEVPYILGQYFGFYRLRIVGDTILIAIRSTFLLSAVVNCPANNVIFAYAFGTFIGVTCVAGVYYGYFYYYIHYDVAGRYFPFGSITDLFPREDVCSPLDLAFDRVFSAWTFFKQGVWKMLVAEGERCTMTFLNVLTLEEQGVYELVANLGSLAPRFVFVPIEERAYSYFVESLEKQAKSLYLTKEHMVEIGAVLGRLVRLMSIIGMILIVCGLPYSNTVLFLYGGSRLSDDEGPGTQLLQANCINMFALALNGVTEAFMFAAMSAEQMDLFDRRLVCFSGIHLTAASILTVYLGSVGFFIANTVHMTLRIIQSCTLIDLKFSHFKINPFLYWLPKAKVLAVFGIALFCMTILMMLEVGRTLFVLIGLIIFAVSSLFAMYIDRDLSSFLVNIYKTKQRA